MFVSGINSLVFYKIGEKRILLAGEFHNTENWCNSKKNPIGISDFVSGISRRIPEDECLDVFLEGAYKMSYPEISDSSGLSYLTKELEPGNKILKFLRLIDTKNKRKNLRVHHVDTRMMIDDSVWSFGYKDYSVPINEISDQFQDSILVKDLLKVIDYLLTINRRGNREYFEKVFRKFEEFEAAKDFEEIESWEKEYFKIIEKELKKLNTEIISRKILITNLRETYHQKIEESSDSYATAIGVILDIPMDLYILSRMFIRFDDKPSATCTKSTIDNIIIYSGSAHTETYRDFLNLSFRTEPQINISNSYIENLCLEIPDFDFWNF